MLFRSELVAAQGSAVERRDPGLIRLAVELFAQFLFDGWPDVDFGATFDGDSVWFGRIGRKEGLHSCRIHYRKAARQH